MLWNWTTAFEDMETLRQEMDHLLERTQRNYLGSSPGYPLLNIYNQDDRLTVVAEVPGVNREDLNIQYLDGVLKLSGERKSPQLGEDKVVHLREERRYGRFEKTVKIPVEVDASQIQARLSDGLLQIELPKPEQVKPRQIAIH